MKLNRKRKGFTLVEIMIVVAIIALLATIAVPNFLRVRKKSQATRVLEELRLIEAAKDQWALEKNKAGGETPAWDDIKVYLKTNSSLEQSGGKDLFDAAYEIGDVDTPPAAASTTYGEFTEVTDDEFWGPYKP